MSGSPAPSEGAAASLIDVLALDDRCLREQVDAAEPARDSYRRLAVRVAVNELEHLVAAWGDTRELGLPNPPKLPIGKAIARLIATCREVARASGSATAAPSDAEVDRVAKAIWSAGGFGVVADDLFSDPDNEHWVEAADEYRGYARAAIAALRGASPAGANDGLNMRMLRASRDAWVAKADELAATAAGTAPQASDEALALAHEMEVATEAVERQRAESLPDARNGLPLVRCDPATARKIIRALRAGTAPPERTMADQKHTDHLVYYRNLAISLGAKPEQMQNEYDRHLAKGWPWPHDVDDGPTIEDQSRETEDCWEKIERLEAGAGTAPADASGRIHHLSLVDNLGQCQCVDCHSPAASAEPSKAAREAARRSWGKPLSERSDTPGEDRLDRALSTAYAVDFGRAGTADAALREAASEVSRVWQAGIAPKGAMDSAIRELERALAAARPPATESSDG